MLNSSTHSELDVFVYGTLQPGERYHHHYCSQHLISAIPAATQGKLYHLSALNYPAMTAGTDWVQGYLLSFRQASILKGLDQLEDYDPERPEHENEYQRQQILIFNRQHHPLQPAWAYLMDPDSIQRRQGIYLPGGHWNEQVAVRIAERQTWE
jgi:gamma-glutamylcyclotransferase (GGCT)/AIG2-like uncharacterized protein YtfP